MQAFTFYASDDKLENRGNYAGQRFTGAAINKAAADHAKKVRIDFNTLINFVNVRYLRIASKYA